MRWTVDEGARLDHFVADHAGCSRAEARRLIAEGAVRVDGRRAAKGVLVRAGAVVDLAGTPANAETRRPVAQPELPLVELVVDEAFVAVAKPAGMPTLPLRPGERGTLANAVVARHPECAAASDDAREGGAAHRLDTDTSGVVLFARTAAAWRALRDAFAGGRVAKEYLALVAGEAPDEGTIDAPLAHADRRRVRVDEAAPDARPAVTRFEVVARSPAATLVRAFTSTGRMHQVRAHLAHAGHPLIGDELYGGPPARGGHVLHAERITFPDPRTGEAVTVEAPLPDARAAAIETWLRCID
jgi:23S rRNA pseudouridine1911/1915/1917 synthase